MELNLRPKNECMFDEISLGEIMLRLDPGEAELKPPVPSVHGRAAVNIMLPVDFAAVLV